MADFRYGFFIRPENKKLGLHPDEKSKTSHVSDHKCKPAIVDAEGKKQPITVLSDETYVIKKDTYVEEFYSSLGEESQYSYTMEYEPVTYYGRRHDKAKNQHPSLARDRPTEVDKFITDVQMEASKPMSPTYRRQISNTRVEDDIINGCHDDYNKKIANKPSGYAKQHAKHRNGYNSNNDEYDDSDDEPRTMTSHTFGLAPLGWARPSDELPARGLSLSGPMNDIGKAIECLKEAANLQSGKSALDHRKKDGYTKTIDSNEAARQYGKLIPLPPVQGAHVATIDSKEAARKYKGTKV